MHARMHMHARTHTHTHTHTSNQLKLQLTCISAANQVQSAAPCNFLGRQLIVTMTTMGWPRSQWMLKSCRQYPAHLPILWVPIALSRMVLFSTFPWPKTQEGISLFFHFFLHDCCGLWHWQMLVSLTWTNASRLDHLIKGHSVTRQYQDHKLPHQITPFERKTCLASPIF